MNVNTGMTDGDVLFSEFSEWLDLTPQKIQQLTYPQEVATSTVKSVSLRPEVIPIVPEAVVYIDPTIEYERRVLEKEKMYELKRRERVMEERNAVEERKKYKRQGGRGNFGKGGEWDQ